MAELRKETSFILDMVVCVEPLRTFISGVAAGRQLSGVIAMGPGPLRMDMELSCGAFVYGAFISNIVWNLDLERLNL